MFQVSLFLILFIRLLNVSIDEQELCYLSTERDASFVQCIFIIHLLGVSIDGQDLCYLSREKMQVLANSCSKSPFLGTFYSSPQCQH